MTTTINPNINKDIEFNTYSTEIVLTFKNKINPTDKLFYSAYGTLYYSWNPYEIKENINQYTIINLYPSTLYVFKFNEVLYQCTTLSEKEEILKLKVELNHIKNNTIDIKNKNIDSIKLKSEMILLHDELNKLNTKNNILNTLIDNKEKYYTNILNSNEDLIKKLKLEINENINNKLLFDKNILKIDELNSLLVNKTNIINELNKNINELNKKPLENGDLQRNTDSENIKMINTIKYLELEKKTHISLIESLEKDINELYNNNELLTKKINNITSKNLKLESELKCNNENLIQENIKLNNENINLNKKLLLLETDFDDLQSNYKEKEEIITSFNSKDNFSNEYYLSRIEYLENELNNNEQNYAKLLVKINKKNSNLVKLHNENENNKKKINNLLKNKFA